MMFHHRNMISSEVIIQHAVRGSVCVLQAGAGVSPPVVMLISTARFGSLASLNNNTICPEGQYAKISPLPAWRYTWVCNAQLSYVVLYLYSTWDVDSSGGFKLDKINKLCHCYVLWNRHCNPLCAFCQMPESVTGKCSMDGSVSSQHDKQHWPACIQ